MDTLVILNFIVNYFLLKVSAIILHIKPPLLRQLAAAGIGGFSSLYIFVPETGIIVGVLYRAAVCSVMVLCGFGFKSTKRFLRAAGVLFLVTCAYGGVMTAVYIFLKPKGMTMVNSVVYFDISRTILIVVSVIAYLLFMLLSAIFSKTLKFAERCDIAATTEKKSVTMKGIVDTGNSVKDCLSDANVIINDSESNTGDS